MRIQYCSDIHLEFPENRLFIKNNPLQPKGEVLVLAGDILPFALLGKPCDFIDYVSDHFKEVYWVPGNHEYYHSGAENWSGCFHEKIKPNVHLLNNKHITINGINLFFTTLWSNISPKNELNIQRNVSDFHLISYKGMRFTARDFNALHQDSLSFLTASSLRNTSGMKNIIVTHHVPTLLNYPEHYKSSQINEAFAVELHEFILKSNIACWIYGHHHCNTHAFKIGGTTLLTNQLGYIIQDEHQLFNRSAILEI